MKLSNIFNLLTLALLLSLAVLTPQLAAAASPCGGAGQRACCVGERIPSCNQGLHEVQPCNTGDCTCGGANPFGAFNSIGRCEPNTPPPVITPCGGPGQRACCVTERVPSCNNGLHEVLGCSTGNCICGGANPFNALKSIGHCEANFVPDPCGGPGQRACCVTERVPSCNNGLHEEPGCSSGNCICGGPNPGNVIKSIGHCVANPTITPCGGPGQRACCVTERMPSCNSGLHEELGCSGPSCICGGPNPLFKLQSIGKCFANPTITPCGGPGQRACCVTERIPSCNSGLHEELGCSGPSCICGGPNPLFKLQSIGKCVANPAQPAATPCGGQNQRACCVTERLPSCNSGLHEELGCTGMDCKCGGANPLGALNSIGHCVADCQTRVNQLEAELAKAKAEIFGLQQRCGQPVSGGKPNVLPPPAQPKQLQQPMIKQSPRQLLR